VERGEFGPDVLYAVAMLRARVADPPCFLVTGDMLSAFGVDFPSAVGRFIKEKTVLRNCREGEEIEVVAFKIPREPEIRLAGVCHEGMFVKK